MTAKTSLMMKSSYLLLQTTIIIILLTISLSHSLTNNIIKTLPGFADELPFNLETGYIGVGEAEERQLFYYFIESQGNAVEDPLMLWLTGGPGCSGLSGLLYEIGPIMFNYSVTNSDLPQLQLNPYSWTKVSNIIFLDSPVGTGFSYGTTSEAYYSDDLMQSRHVREFMSKWLMEHSKFTNNPLYIAGDSYSGKTVPFVVQEILTGNVIGLKPKMNIKGYILGNPITMDQDVQPVGVTSTIKDTDVNAKYKFGHRVSLLSDELYEFTKIICNGNFVNVDVNNTRCTNALQRISDITNNISYPNVLEPKCNIYASPKPVTKQKNTTMQDLVDFFGVGVKVLQQSCRHQNYVFSHTWANAREVRKALHIQEGTVDRWDRCNESVSYSRNVQSSFSYHQNFTKESLDALIYSGDQDMAIPYVATLKWIKKLNISTSENWRPWFVNGQVAGYVTEYTSSPFRLIYTTIKGGGHTAPEYKPQESFAMIDRWFSLRPL